MHYDYQVKVINSTNINKTNNHLKWTHHHWTQKKQWHM